MQEARDDAYCFLLARRAAARAALHLGIEDVSLEALDALGEILVAYLERFGRTLGCVVEASGRSSAHASAIDALKAAELCTTPAVQRVHISTAAGGASAAGGSSVAGSTAVAADGTTEFQRRQQQELMSSQNESPQDLSWKGLAAFCFGPDWHREDPQLLRQQGKVSIGVAVSAGADGGGAEDGNAEGRVAGPAGGKVGPSAAAASDPSAGDSGDGMVGGALAVSGGRGGQPAAAGGWNAPFPDEVPIFPVTPSSAATGGSTGRRRGSRKARAGSFRRYSRTSPPNSMEDQETVLGADKYETAAAVAAAQKAAAIALASVDEDDAKLSDTALEERLLGMPDAAFLREWGDLERRPSLSDAMVDSRKRKTGDDGGTTRTGDTAKKDDSSADEDGRPRKKARFGGGAYAKKKDSMDVDGLGAKVTKADSDVVAAPAPTTHPSRLRQGAASADYVPRFYPSFPSAADSIGRTVLDLDTSAAGGVGDIDGSDGYSREAEEELARAKAAAETAMIEREFGVGANVAAATGYDPALQVRSALVSLEGQRQQRDSYWGSGWDAVSSSSPDDAAARRLAVPLGAGAGTVGDVQPQIVPLARASGTRVSRILEGSMDPANV